MNNSIDPNRLPGVLPPVRSESASAGGAPPSRPVAGGGDSVRLTADATQLAAIDRALASAGDVDVQKVNAVREALEAGRYSVDAGRIADRMLQFERQLGS